MSTRAEPPFDEEEGVPMARVTIDKRFEGALQAESTVYMLSAGNPASGSAGYVAMERVRGSLDGRRGTFVLQHSGTMHAGETTLSVTVVPGSGTGRLLGIAGAMTIRIEDGQHCYDLEYELE